MIQRAVDPNRPRGKRSDMASKTISTGYPSGISLGASFTYVLIASTGSIGGGGTTINAVATVVNEGTASSSGSAGSYGVLLQLGGTFSNFATVYGHEGVTSGPTGRSGVTPGNVLNYDTIDGVQDGVQLLDGGTLSNLSNALSAQISGGRNGIYVSASAAATIENSGYIAGGTGAAVNIATGSIYNAGIIAGYPGDGILARGAATISNQATIFSPDGAGVRMLAGGELTNGSVANSGAVIESNYVGVSAKGALVLNYGGIIANGPLSVGAVITGGGELINGYGADHAALVQGLSGVYASASEIINAGTIQSTRHG